MKKFLYFASAAADGTASTEEVVCFPADQMSHMEMATATQMRVYFESSQENDADSGIDAAHAVLTINTGKHKEVMEAIAGAVASANAINNPMITVADSEDSKFLHPDITACASIAIVDAS
jgi:thiazole synthase ThiGH ThiG subunit